MTTANASDYAPPARDLQTVMREMGKAEFVMIDDLHVDARYQPQQRHRASRVRPIAEAWDPRLVGALLVSCRQNERDESYWVIDGGTRLAAAILRRESIREDVFGFHCILHQGLTVGDEARMFRLLNGNRRQVHVVDRYYAALLEEDPVAMAMQRTLAVHGLRIAYTPTATDISAVQSVEHLHLWGVLPGTLEVVEAAWPGTPLAHARDVLLGVGAFLHVYQARDVDLGELAGSLHDDPEALLEDADYVAPDSYTGRSSWARVAAAVRERYNHRRGRRGHVAPFAQPNLPRAASTVAGRS